MKVTYQNKSSLNKEAIDEALRIYEEFYYNREEIKAVGLLNCQILIRRTNYGTSLIITDKK